MLKYVGKRLIYIVAVFFIVSLIMFLIFKSIPVDQAGTMIEGSRADMTPEQYEQVYQAAVEKLGLDKPVPVQYFRWITNVLQGDFGYSSHYRKPVIQVIVTPMKWTAFINVINLVIVFAITIFLGVSTAVKRGTVYDNGVQVFTVLGYSLPNFLIAILLILVFSATLEWLPFNGMYSPDFSGTTGEWIADRAKHMAMPLMAMVFTSLGNLTRQVRTAMIDALSMDYVRTARSKGLSEKVVIYSHAFRNALIPIITVMAAWFVNILSGSVMFERIFLWNGMGATMIDALNNYDYNTAIAISMFYVVIALVGNLVTDIAYGIADPRVKIAE